MKILGVVTLVSPGGEYGGPVRVAVNQLAALRERGHDVLLVGGHRGYSGEPPHELDGVPCRLFPARKVVPGAGFAGLASPSLWRAVRRWVPHFDVIHVHAARDLVTLPAARIAQTRGATAVVQTHGMIDETNNPLAVPLDALLTRPVLEAARHVTYLTTRERDSLRVVSRDRASLVEVINGVPAAEAAVASLDRPAHVLYLARLAHRKRPQAFVDAAVRLAMEYPEARFTLVGPDEGEGDAVKAAIASSDAGDRIRWVGAAAPEQTLQWMREATLYVLPSVDEPYPMSVLEAMSVALPVIVTDTNGLAGFVRDNRAGTVVGVDQQDLEQAMRELIGDRSAAEAAGERGRSAVRQQRSMSAVAARLESLYR